jgi:Schlafen, AlbA_2
MNNQTLSEFISSSEPLAPELLPVLLEYREENTLVDYKESFSNDDKHWLDLTKDVLSLANARGGYICFGVKDRTYAFVGLDQPAMDALSDADKILQKVNRFLDPKMTGLRSKVFELQTKKAVVLFVPAFAETTYVVSEDARYRHPSGKEATVLRKGTIWIKRSAGNQLAGSRELDEIYRRRLEAFRESILGKIRQVVEAPSDSHVYLLTEASQPEDAERRFVITGAAQSPDLEGRSFTVPPNTPEEEVAAWSAMAKKSPQALPPEIVVWSWYRNRDGLTVSPELRLEITRFSFSWGAPAFFWLQKVEAPRIKKMLREVQKHLPGSQLEEVVGVSAFYGRRFFESFLKSLGKRQRLLPPRLKHFPGAGPQVFFGQGMMKTRRNLARPKSEEDFRRQVEKDLENLAERAVRGVAGVMERWEARALDCYLYAPRGH